HLRIWFLLLFCAVLPALATAQDNRKAHESILQSAGIKTDDRSLIDVFRSRTLSAAEQTRLEALIRLLGADTYDERVKASKDLVAAGPRAASVLRPALTSSDAEVRRRAAWCLRQIDPKPEAELFLAAAALLAARKPAGIAQVLLAYLPFAEDE